MHFAIRQKNFKAIKLLIEKNASLIAKNNGKKSPGEIADDDLKSFINELVNKKKKSMKREMRKLMVYFSILWTVKIYFFVF